MPRYRRQIVPALVVCSLVFLSPRPDPSGTLWFPMVPKVNLVNVDATKDRHGDGIYTVKDLTYRNDSDPLVTDIVLSFNTPSSRLLRDDTRHYRIARAAYNFVSGKGSLGGGSALFFKKEHGVSVETVRGAWLGTCDDLGSFTLEFRFMPYEIRDGAIIFSRIGYLSGTRRGIEISLRNGRIVAALYGIFDVPLGKKRDAVLMRGTPLSRMKWHHFVLSYDRISGKLAKYLNGEEEEVLYITESGEAFNGVYAPSFGYRTAGGDLVCVDAPPAVLGGNFTGLIDEFRISYRHFEDLEKKTKLAYRNYRHTGAIGRIPYNIEGVVTSPVYRFAETGTRVMEFRWNEEIPDDTFIWMQFRISDTNFVNRDAAARWYRVKNRQKKIFLMKSDDGAYLRGKYYQWRAHLVPSPDGMRAPRLSGIELDYRLDLAPNPPQLLEAAIADRRVTLRWKKNIDHDILGYRIYYGTMPGRYDGIISRVNGSRITNATTAGGLVQVTISDDVIEENRSLDAVGRLTYPLLQNTVLYYFAVSAYDSYKPDTPYNHESEPSRPVGARPYGGSEIR